MLAVEVWAHNWSGEAVCGLCGESFEMECAGAKLVSDSGPVHSPDGRVLCEVCAICLDAGPDFAARRMREHAALLREWAARVEALADRVEEIGLDRWASPEQVEAVRDLAREAALGLGPEG